MENLKKISCFTGSVVLIAGVVFFIFKFWIFGTNPQNRNTRIEEIHRNYRIYSPPMPDTPLYFAGERVPLEFYDVRRSLDYELLKIMYWHSETILYFKRANYIFPVIEPILKKYGIPDDFKYLMVAESGLTNVTSPAGAKGYWQFMKSTAKEYGLEINDWVDERINLTKSTVAACKYLRDSYGQFRSWTLAAASYNMGRDAFKKQMLRQKEKSFYNLLLNRETSRYMYRILAFKIIMTHPRDYGFNLDKEDLYYPVRTDTIEVDTTINDLIAFAKQHNTNYKILKQLNPWLISDKLVNKSGKVYRIAIPKLPEARKTRHY